MKRLLTWTCAFALLCSFAAPALADTADEAFLGSLAVEAPAEAPAAPVTETDALLPAEATRHFVSTCRDQCKFMYLDCLDSGRPYSECSAERSACLAAC
jgi:hypothetical protein